MRAGVIPPLPLLVSVTAGVALLALVRLAWRSPFEGGRRLAGLALAVAGWCLATGIAPVVAEPSAVETWSRFASFAAGLAGPAWALFAFRYVGLRLPNTIEFALLMPSLLALLPGTASWVAGYAAAVASAGALALLLGWWRNRGGHRWRYAALAGVFLAVATTMSAAPALVGDAWQRELVPLAAALAVMVVVVLVVQRRLFDTLPLAHRLVFDSLEDAQIVIDRYGRILDLNPAAEQLVDVPLHRARGRTLSTLAPWLPVPSEGEGRLVVPDPSSRRALALEMHALGRTDEHLLTVEDVTDHARAKEILQRRGYLLEAVDALLATVPGVDPEEALGDTLRNVGQALDLKSCALIMDHGTGAGFDVRSAWSDGGPAAWHAGGAYEAEGLSPVRDAIRRGHTTLVAAPTPEGVRVALPLRLGGRDWGALVLEGGDPEVLRELGDPLASVVRSLSSWLERDRAEAERQRADRFRRGLLDLTRELLRGEVGTDLYRRALAGAVEAIGGADAGYLFVRRSGGRYACAAAAGPRVRRGSDAAPDERTAGWIPAGGSRILTGSDAAAAGGPHVQASLVAGVALEGRTEAILRLDSERGPEAFGALEASMLETFAAQVGSVLRRLEMQARSDRAAREGRLVADIERLLLSSDAIDTFFPALTRLVFASGSLPLTRVVLLPLDDDRQGIELHGPDGRDPEPERRLRQALPDVRGLPWLVSLLAAEGPQGREELHEDSVWTRAGIQARSLLAFPLHGGERPWGAILWLSDRPGAFGEAGRALLGQVVAGLELAVLRQRERERRELQLARMQALVRVGEELRSVTTRSRAVEATLTTVLRTTRVDHCALLLLDREPAALRVAAALHRRGGGFAADASLAEAAPLPWRSLGQERAVTAHDPTGLDDAPRWRDRAPSGYVGAPVLNGRGETVGVLVATLDGRSEPFGADEVNFVEAIAQSCASALVRLALLERRRTQAREYRELWEEARQSEERFRLLAENMSDSVCLHDVRGRLVYVSPSVHGLLGRAPEDLLGLDPRVLVHPDDRDTLRDALYLPLSRGIPVHGVTLRLRHPDGRELWVETHAQPVVDDEGRVVNLVSSSRDVTERKRIEERLVHGALYDDLTGLPNRALLMDRLRHALERSRRQERRFALLFLDLDRFKLVNDSLGHGVGDELLAAIARRLSGCVRGSDTVARLGGDEFCILLEEIDGEEVVLRTAERVQDALTQRFPLGDTDLFTSASIGIAFSAVHYQHPDELLRDADIAMYRAKAAGKARHEVFASGMHAQAVDRLALETALHGAIERDELRLAFQPVVELREEGVTGVEALVRWAHPQRGFLPPAEFVPLAEESGLIVQLDRWVLERALLQLRRWEERFPAAAAWTVSVNISPMHFALADPAGTILAIVRKTGLEPSRLKLEVTERALMGRGDAVVDALTVLRAHGVAVQIDDFGTGYSSLVHLQKLPIDSLKVDGGFVRRMGTDDRQRDLVGTIVSLARGLGIEAVAEGVEEADQLEALRDMGCAFGQGWLWAEATDAELFADRYLAAAMDEA